MIAASIGTPFEVQTADSVLFLEDTGEPPYRIDRMITHLKNAKVFDRVAGVLFGAMEKCVDPYNDLKAVIRDLFGNARFPVAFGLKSGHGAVNRSIRLGTPTEMKSVEGIVRQNDRTVG